MAVQGGGGGKKVPPGGPPRPHPTTNPGNAPGSTPPGAAPAPGKATHTTGPQKPVTVSSGEATPGSGAGAGDSFDHFKSTNSDIHKGADAALEGAFAHAASTPSGIDNLVKVIDAARTQLAGENRALRGQAQTVVERLVASGFAPTQLERARAELLELRKRMAALRKRLKHLQRRLKSTFASAGKTGDAQLAKTLGAQLQRLQKLEPGMSRALLALQTIEQAYATFSDGSTPVLRLHVGESGAPDRVGRALAQLAPGAAIARATLSLLREGPEAPAPAAPAAPDDDGNALLDGPRAFVRALLPSPSHGAPELVPGERNEDEK